MSGWDEPVPLDPLISHDPFCTSTIPCYSHVFCPGGAISLHCCEFGVLVKNLTSLKTLVEPYTHNVYAVVRKIYLNPVTLSHPGLISDVMMVLFVYVQMCDDICHE